MDCLVGLLGPQLGSVKRSQFDHAHDRDRSALWIGHLEVRIRVSNFIFCAMLSGCTVNDGGRFAVIDGEECRRSLTGFEPA